LVPAEIPKTDVLRGVVVSVVLVAAFQTLDVLTLAVVRVRKSTV